MLIVAGTALAFYIRSRNAGVSVESIAVLPFTSQNQDELLKDFTEDSEGRERMKRQRERDRELEVLSDQLTDNIFNNLPRLPNLRIIPSDASSRYKGKDARNKVVAGRELGVHAVFSGEVVQTGDQLTVRVELVDARYNEHLWGNRYSCKVEGLDTRRRDISQDLTRCLELNRQGKRCGN